MASCLHHGNHFDNFNYLNFWFIDWVLQFFNYPLDKIQQYFSHMKTTYSASELNWSEGQTRGCMNNLCICQFFCSMYLSNLIWRCLHYLTGGFAIFCMIHFVTWNLVYLCNNCFLCDRGRCEPLRGWELFFLSYFGGLQSEATCICLYWGRASE